jgi:hypothetical protein
MPDRALFAETAADPGRASVHVDAQHAAQAEHHRGLSTRIPTPDAANLHVAQVSSDVCSSPEGPAPPAPAVGGAGSLLLTAHSYREHNEVSNVGQTRCGRGRAHPLAGYRGPLLHHSLTCPRRATGSES